MIQSSGVDLQPHGDEVQRVRDESGLCRPQIAAGLPKELQTNLGAGLHPRLGDYLLDLLRPVLPLDPSIDFSLISAA
ncbi:hypothetical protein [Burkholderia cepacia]|uniref:hypothetical protein n=1 Tax=Burkholderia cepacia TaxID=292 RepID=UPI00264B6900|nr:hypothetical protein [Burkholderia cepacia]MDN7911722.1 hypothetical protein [Burkholderia cepacia]